MPILASAIKTQVLSILDAEGSDRYRDAEDFIPAINNTIRWSVTLFSAAMSAKKISPNVLSELTVTKVWQLSSLSRFAFDPAAVGHEFWIELALYPQASTIPPFQSVPPLSPTDYVYLPNLSFVKSKYSAARITEEQDGINTKNPFFPGNSVLTNPELKTYGYMSPSDYSGAYTAQGVYEFQVMPDLPFGCCAMKYIKQPLPITAMTDTIPFPSKILDLMAAKTANFIAEKQGDQTTLYVVSDRDINQLATLLY